MNRLRLLAFVPLVAAVVVAVAALTRGDDRADPIEVASDGPVFTSLDELVAASEVIVVATVADVSDGRTVSAPDDPDAGIRTRLVELDVTPSLVGDPPAPLVVEEPAELLDGTPVVVDGVAPLVEGDQAMWFLVAGEGDALPYHALVGAQGRYEIVGATLEPSSDDRLSRALAARGLDALVSEVRDTQ